MKNKEKGAICRLNPEGVSKIGRSGEMARYLLFKDGKRKDGTQGFIVKI